MTYFWAWFNVLTMGLDVGEMDGDSFDEIGGEINGEVDGENQIVRLRDDPARSLAALKVRGGRIMVVPLPSPWLYSSASLTLGSSPSPKP